MNYDFWKQSLAGKKPKMFVDDPQLGFYRRGIYKRVPGKRSTRVGWTPVAIYKNGEYISARIGIDEKYLFLTDRDEINELWSYIAAYPITEEVYRAVAERGEPWPDSHEEKPTFVGVDMGKGDDKTITTEIQDGKVVAQYEGTPADKIAREIADCQVLLGKYATIESDEQSSKARSLQQRFLDLRGEAKKQYDAANRPLLDEQKRLRGIWSPLQDAADAASVALRRAMGAWEDVKRENARKAEEANRKAAEQAAKANQPAPPPVAPNAPPPASQIRGGSGRAAVVKVQKYVTEIDVDKVFQQFREAPELVQLLSTLAERAVRAGVAVPGATVVERSDVR